jgi:hypothetical protein
VKNFGLSLYGSLAAGNSKLSDLANNTPSYIFRELVQLGDGRMLGQRLLQWWMQDLDRNEIYHLLGSSHAIDSMAFRRLETRFQRWSQGLFSRHLVLGALIFLVYAVVFLRSPKISSRVNSGVTNALRCASV